MDPHLLIAIVLSALIGVSLGLLGGGGSILAVPLLVYVAQIDVRTAIGMSLAVVGATSLGGAVVHARRGRVRLRAALLFGGAGMVGAPLGAQVTHLVPPRALLVLFAALMIVVGALMLRVRRPPSDSVAPRPRRLRVLGAGLGVGLLTGFLGVGGGFLIVPALTMFAGLPIRSAIGTSLLVITLNAAAGLVGHVRHGSLPLDLTLAFSAASVVGVVLGVRLSAGMAPVQLRRVFAVFVILIGLALLAGNARPA
ncbi:MAG: sulfite exporter TauE/SafE family protein [Acidobacteriota bacterium]